MTRIKPRGFTRNATTDAVMLVEGKQVFSAVKPAYVEVGLLGVPRDLDSRRQGWLMWTPTPPPAFSRVIGVYTISNHL